MNSERKKITEFLREDPYICVPIYQRIYSWNEINCRKLLEDIINFKIDTGEPYFIGSIVSLKEPSNIHYHYPIKILIDGQQRITTLFLILLSLYKLIHSNKNFSESRILSRIESLLFVENDMDYIEEDSVEGKRKMIKLQLLEGDLNNLESILYDYEDLQADSILVKNYTFIYNYLSEYIGLNEDTSIKILYNKIQSASFVNIFLDDKLDDAQQIFESLNSTGLSLTTSELINNYILMKTPIDLQDYVYDKYLNQIEKLLGDKSDDFFKNYCTLKKRELVNKDQLYEVFKEIFDLSIIANKLESTLVEIEEYLDIYIKIIKNQFNDRSINSIVLNLNKLVKKYFHSFFMGLYHDYNRNILSYVEFCSILRLLENYCIRRDICELGNSNLEQVFSSMYFQINKEDSINSCIQFIVAKENDQRFPKDYEFTDYLKNSDIYISYKSHSLLVLLQRIEETLNKEYLFYNYKVCRILSGDNLVEMANALNKNSFEIKKEFLNNLCNLRLTFEDTIDDNINYKEKRDLIMNNIDYKLQTNKLIYQRNVSFTEKELMERSNYLISKILNIFSYPQSIQNKTLN